MNLHRIYRRAVAIVDRLRQLEPAWLPARRKAIIPPAIGLVTGLAARHGIELGTVGSELVGLTVTSFMTWLIPNKKPPTPAA